MFKPTKRYLAMAAMAIALCAASAWAQGRVFYVARDLSIDDRAQYQSVQKAIDAAGQGDIVEILDTETYNEQVTIDSTKHGLTLRSSNPTAVVKPVIRWLDTVNQGPRTYQESRDERLAGQFETCGALRVIRARGVTIDGIAVDGVEPAPFAWGAIWNQKDQLFHGNAAITLVVAGNTVIRNSEMRNAYFGVNVKDRNTGGVYGNPNPADNDITIPLSRFGRVGNHLIEHNKVHNNSVAFFFESAWDLGSTVRYNLIYSNYHRGMPVDGNGKLTIAAMANPGSVGTKVEPQNTAHGAFVFKDMLYTPVAIYNNTLYDNNHHLMADWKTGAPHLIFNNIFAKQHSAKITAAGGMELDIKFPNRMHNNTFSATDGLQVGSQGQNINSGCKYPTWNDPNAILNYRVDTSFVQGVQMANQFPQPASISHSVTIGFECEYGPGNIQAGTTSVSWQGPVVGTLLGEGGATAFFPTGAGNRWLEVVGGSYVGGNQGSATVTLPDYVLSTNATSANFMRPDWDDPIVAQYIKNSGWELSGTPVVRNSNGSNADLGAIPSTGRQQPVVARIQPTSVVLINGTNADAKFNLLVEGGQFNNPEIKFLRWVAPLPDYPEDPVQSASLWGANDAKPVPSSAINVLNPASQPGGASVEIGGNSKRFTIPTALSSTQKYGFFEIIVEGTDAAGNKVMSDIGFLPYRQLNHILEIEVLRNGVAVSNPVVTVGEAVTIRVTAKERSGTTFVDFNPGSSNQPLKTEYMLSHPTSRMWQQIDPPRNALTGDDDLKTGTRYTETYTVYFTKAGIETINGAGEFGDIAFQGSLTLTVNPGPAADVMFIDPIPKADLGGGLASVINPGVTRDVIVMVTDKYGNPVNTAVPVAMKSESPNIGDLLNSSGNVAGGATVTESCDPATGLATFQARVTNGAVNNTFDLTATILNGTASDVGALRVGVTRDALRAFYTQPTTVKPYQTDFNAVTQIEGSLGDWIPIWIQATAGDSSVITTKNSLVCVEMSDGLLVSLSADGSNAADQIMGSLTNGVLQVWVGMDGSYNEVVDGSVMPRSVTEACGGALDNSIGSIQRREIFFTKPESNIDHGAVFAEKNGFGRPDRATIDFKIEDPNTGFVAPAGATDPWTVTVPRTKPDSVELKWWSEAGPGKSVVAKARGDQIQPIGRTRLELDFSHAVGLPKGWTGEAVGFVMTVFGGDAGDGNNFFVRDSIGLIIAAASDSIGSKTDPFIREQRPGATNDTLMFFLSEIYGSSSKWEEGDALLVHKGDEPPMSGELATGGTPVKVNTITQGSIPMYYTLELPLNSVAAGDWIRINPAANIVDAAGNVVNDGNRWVKVHLQETPPSLVSSFYYDDDADGKMDRIVVNFSKPVNKSVISSIGLSWYNLSGTLSDVAGCVTNSNGDSTITIDLTCAASNFPHPPDIITTGDIVVTVTFSADKGWSGWNYGRDDFSARDKAAPVLIRAELKMGGVIEGEGDLGNHPDTLIVVYSEFLTNPSVMEVSPIQILTSTWQTPRLRYSTHTVEDGYYRRVVYIVEDYDGAAPSNGDSVRINIAAGISDLMMVADDPDVGNIQDNPNNRRVPLEVKIGDAPWRVLVRNNPFQVGDKVVVEFDPGLPNADKVEVSIVLLDNMGKVVLNKVMVHSEPNSKKAVWEWDGRNKNGRYVGTGTYLMKATARVYVSGATIEAGRDILNVPVRKIGFVRNKK